MKIPKQEGQDWDTFRIWLKSTLQSEVGVVTFTKKDGTERVMRCTLKEDHLPLMPVNEDKAVRKENKDVLSVYDLDIQAWRSFTVKNVTKVMFET